MTDFYLDTKLEDYSETESGKWLKTFNWYKVDIQTLPFCKEGLCTAMYCVMTNSIKVAPDKDDAVYFGTVVHELYHAGQRNELGWFGYLLLKTFARWRLEKPAKEAELAAVQWFCDNKGA